MKNIKSGKMLFVIVGFFCVLVKRGSAQDFEQEINSANQEISVSAQRVRQNIAVSQAKQKRGSGVARLAGVPDDAGGKTETKIVIVGGQGGACYGGDCDENESGDIREADSRAISRAREDALNKALGECKTRNMKEVIFLGEVDLSMRHRCIPYTPLWCSVGVSLRAVYACSAQQVDGAGNHQPKEEGVLP